MSIQLNFRLLQQAPRDIAVFVVGKVREIQLAIASKQLPWKLILRILAVLFIVFVVITMMVQFSHRAEPILEEIRLESPRGDLQEAGDPSLYQEEFIPADDVNSNIPPNMEQTQIIKPQPKMFPVNIIQMPVLACKEGKTKLMMIVYSRPENVGERNAIRQTWGRMENFKDMPQETQLWKLFFVMARSYTPVDQQVAQENMIEKDILMGEFQDSPFEDTRKFMMAMQWFTQNSKVCEARFVMRSQDNVFHNMRSVMGWIEARFEHRPVITSDLYLGKLLRMDRPIRDPNHALYVPPSDFNREFFPEFVQSPVYFLTYQSYVRMSLIMPQVIPVAMEDAYVGLLAEKIGLKPSHNDHFHMLSKSLNLCHHLKLFFIFNVLPSEHITIFSELDDNRSKPECQEFQDADYF